MANKENEIFFIVSTRRVTKVVEGGANHKVSILVVVGDGNGHVGFGIGNSAEHASALEKAKNIARKNMVEINLLSHGGGTTQKTVTENVLHKFKASKVEILQAAPGHGIIAGTTMRYVFVALGLTDVIAKAHQSRNPINLIPCTINALKKSITRRKNVEVK